MIAADEPSPVAILEQIDIAPVWSVHRCGSPELLSHHGRQYVAYYDADRRIWVREFESPLIDGQGERSAYVLNSGMPLPGPDGRFHLLWVWRETPDHATNHALSYARTVGDDLSRWESAAGRPVQPPFTIGDRELLVDGSPPGGGMSNVLRTLNWDSKNRPVISYHKFDADGFSQIYNARFDDGAWRIVQATDWNLIWGRVL